MYRERTKWRTWLVYDFECNLEQISMSKLFFFFLGWVQFVVFEKLTSACLFQIAWEKPCDYLLIIYMEKYEMLIIIKHKQSARIKCKYNLFKPCARSNQPRRIKTIISNDIFTSLRRKKVQSPASSSRNCSVCVRITFEEMESFPRFNRVCFLISALDRSSKVLSWVGS